MSRRTNALVAEMLQERGWQVMRGRKHYKAFPPDKNKPGMAFPMTPSDSRRGMHNLLADIKRRGTQLPNFPS